MSSNRDERRAVQAEKEREIALLESQLASARAQAEALRAELAVAPVATAPAVPSAPQPTGPATPEEKVTLFRALFRGREDVYPTRWTSAKPERAAGRPPARTSSRGAEKRLRGHRAIGYARGEAPLRLAEPPEEPTVEYDEEALLAAEAADAYPQAHEGWNAKRPSTPGNPGSAAECIPGASPSA